jgi:hypothetical protein
MMVSSSQAVSCSGPLNWLTQPIFSSIDFVTSAHYKNKRQRLYMLRF